MNSYRKDSLHQKWHWQIVCRNFGTLWLKETVYLFRSEDAARFFESPPSQTYLPLVNDSLRSAFRNAHAFAPLSDTCWHSQCFCQVFRAHAAVCHLLVRSRFLSFFSKTTSKEFGNYHLNIQGGMLRSTWGAENPDLNFHSCQQ